MRKDQIKRLIDAGVPIYGDLEYRNKHCALEDAELVTFVTQLREKHPKLATLFIHIPNEGKREMDEVQILKRKGALNKGAVDELIPADISFVGELKREDHTLSVIYDEQINYLINAHQLGAFAFVALGWRANWQALEDWLKL